MDFKYNLYRAFFYGNFGIKLGYISHFSLFLHTLTILFEFTVFVHFNAVQSTIKQTYVGIYWLHCKRIVNLLSELVEYRRIGQRAFVY